MPNTLVHFGLQGLTARTVRRDVDLRWVFVGCLIPDLPWIVVRLLDFLPFDPAFVRLYALGQASLLCCLILAGGLAALADRPGFVFAILSANAVVHLLLDACEIKWGNGAHLFAPWSWKLLSFGLLWPESATVSLVTAVGLGVTLAAFRSDGALPAPIKRPPSSRIVLASVLVVFYMILPLALMDGAYASDSRYFKTLAERRVGATVELDRVRLRKLPGRDLVKTNIGSEMRVTGRTPRESSLVSIRGRIRDANTIEVLELRVHSGWLRDAASYVALGLFVALWLLPYVGRARARSPA